MPNQFEEYRRKRNFTRTPEPGDEIRKDSDSPIFVIQKHASNRLHYDVRLEIDGVLKSWAVPKGPSTNPRAKRLAVLTEDHPLAYADFEGVIPKDEYGGGIVMIWDRGTYQNLMAIKDTPLAMAESFERGHIEVWLEGAKLTGAYALIRMKGGKSDQWLLIKMKDDRAAKDRDVTQRLPDSVLTNRSLEEIERQNRNKESSS